LLAVGCGGLGWGKGVGGGFRKAEEEPIVELSATTTTPRGARLGDAQQAEDLRNTP
jgi:hypothetical protein